MQKKHKEELKKQDQTKDFQLKEIKHYKEMVADEAEKNQILKENEEQTTKKLTEKLIHLE